MFTQLLRSPELGGTMNASVWLIPSASTSTLFMHVTNMGHDIVAVQEFLVTNRALIIPFACVRLHMSTELGFCMESKTADLKIEKKT